MKVYTLVHYTNVASVTAIYVTSCLTKEEAQQKMREEWGKISGYYNTCNGKHECTDDSAVVSDGKDNEQWVIKESDLDVHVAVRVDGGLVSEIHSNADVSAEVFDLDVSSFAEADECVEVDQKEKELETLVSSSNWRRVL